MNQQPDGETVRLFRANSAILDSAEYCNYTCYRYGSKQPICDGITHFDDAGEIG